MLESSWHSGFINGTMLVLDASFGAVTKRRDRAGKAIQCIKFSPNDEICAAGGHDQLIMTYDVKNNFKPLKKLRGHSDDHFGKLIFLLIHRTLYLTHSSSSIWHQESIILEEQVHLKMSHGPHGL